MRPSSQSLTVIFLLAVAMPSMHAQAAGPSGQIQDPAADHGLTGQGGSDLALYFRELGVEAQREGRQEGAHAYFLRAARLADKLSQAAIAEQYWQGQGVEADRVLGYVWMDLAAERGAPALLALREAYWQVLSPAERTRVSTLGPELYAVFGDAAAQPRVAQEQRREKYKIVGSRVGWDSNVNVCIGARQDAYSGCVTSTHAEAVRGEP
jgi:uncharacterized protein